MLTNRYSSRRQQNIKILQQELKSLKVQPLEGFRIENSDESIYKWNVGIFGPPGTIYEGGYFKARINFPMDYPYSPPQLRFLTEIFHPNIYDNGEVCISILHPAINDVTSGELPSERWNPSQTVRTVLLSVISMLNEPNCTSPANVDASILYRKYKDASEKKKPHTQYAITIRSQVNKSREIADKDGVTIPTTEEDYTIRGKPSASSHHLSLGSSMDIEENSNMFYDDDCVDSDDAFDVSNCSLNAST